MASRQKEYSTVVNCEAKVNINSALNSLKALRNAINSKDANPKKLKLLADVDKQIAQIEEDYKKIAIAQDKGFSNNDEIKKFTKATSDLGHELEMTQKALAGIAETDFSEGISKFKNELKKLKTELNDLQSGLSRKAKQTITDAGLSKDTARSLRRNSVEKGYTRDLVVEERKRVAEQIALREQALEAQRAVYQQESFEKYFTGKNVRRTLNIENFSDSLILSQKYANTPYGRDVRVQGENGRYKRQFNSAAQGYINTEYQEILANAAKQGEQAESVLSALREALSKYGIELQATETLEKKIETDLGAVKTQEREAQSKRGNLTKGQQSELNKQQADIEKLKEDEKQLAALEQQIEALQIQIEKKKAEILEKESQSPSENFNDSDLGKKTKDSAENSEKLAENIQKVNSELDQAGNTQGKIDSEFSRFLSQLEYAVGFAAIFQNVRNEINRTLDDIRDLDKAYSTIAMVTTKTVEDLWSSYGQYAEMANKLGQTTESAIQASSLFYQQGLDTADALRLTEDTMKLATLAGSDFKEATSQMTAALRGFHMEMDQGAHITDVYSELAAHAAADVNGIAYAMSKTASIANSAGMSFENTAAFLTQMIETTQEAPENLGTAMKTVIARFTELKENVAGTAESEFDDLDYNKVDKALKTVGVSLKDINGQFRNLDDVFIELSQKWNTLDRNSQRYIATIAAGSRQQSRFIAMMENYERTAELINIAGNSAGRADEQFSKYADTVEYKVNRLQNTWEQFRVNFLSSDLYKGILDIANIALPIITNMTNGITGIANAFITVTAAVSGFKKVLKGLQSGSSEFAKGWRSITGQKNEREITVDAHIEGATKGAKIYEQAIERAGARIAGQVQPEGSEPNEVSERGAEAYKWGVRLHLIANIAQQVALGIAAGRVIQGIISSIVNNAKSQLEENYQKQVSNLSTVGSMSGYNSANTNLSSLIEAKKSIDLLSHQTYLNSIQQAELTKATEYINSNYPDYIKSYDENTGKIELLGDKLNEEIKTQQELVNALKERSLGEIATRRGIAAQSMSQTWANTGVAKNSFAKTWSNSSAAQNGLTTGLGVAGGIGALIASGAMSAIVTALATAAAGPIGTAIAAVASKALLGAAIGAGVGVGLNSWANIYSKNNLDKEEILARFAQLPEEVKSKVYEDINTEHEQNIKTQSDLSAYLGDNTSKLEQLTQTTSEILTEVAKQQGQEDRTTAVQEAVIESFKGQEEYNEKLPETMREAFIKTYHKDATTEFEQVGSSLADAFSGLDVKKQEKKLTKTILGDYPELISDYENFLGTIEAATEKGRLKDYTTLTSAQQRALGDLGYDSEAYQKIQGYELDTILARLNEDYINTIVGRLIEQSSKEVYDDIAELTETKIWPDIMSAYVDGISAGSMTYKDIEKYANDLEQKIKDSTELSSDQKNDLISGIFEQLQIEQIETQHLNNETAMRLFGIDPSIFEEISYEAETSLANIASNFNGTPTALAIGNQLNEAFKMLPDTLDNETFEKVSSYIATQLNPDSFDILLLDEYIDKIENMTGDTAAARQIVNSLYSQWLRYDLIKPITDLDAYNDRVKELKSILSSLGKDFDSFYKIAEKGVSELTASDLEAIADNQYNQFFDFANKTFDIEGALNSYIQQATEEGSRLYELQTKLNEEGLTAEERAKNEADFNNQVEIIKQRIYDTTKSINDHTEELAKNEEKIAKTLDDQTKSLDKLNKQRLEAEKAQREAYLGSDVWNASLDGLYNVDTALKNLTDEQELYNLQLKDTEELLDTIDILNKKNINYHQSEVLRGAKQNQLTNAINNTDSWLSQYSQYFNNSNGSLSVDFDALNSAQMPDLLKDEIVRRIQERNTWTETLTSLVREQTEANQARIEEQKTFLGNYNRLLKDGADILEENAKEEAEILSNKYEAMKDADDEYLNALEKAIDRQRKLRQQEDSWNSLATQEKRLSLMRRDTSGANAKEVQSLEKEVAKNRQELLDNSIDNIIDQLKEDAEKREEARQAIIDSTNAVVENTQWTQIMQQQMASWTNADDAVAWYLENNKELNNITTEEIEELVQTWRQEYLDGAQYLGTQNQNYQAYLSATQDEINNAAAVLESNLIAATDRTSQKVNDDIIKNQQQADESLADINTQITETQNNITETKKELEKAQLASANWNSSLQNIDTSFENILNKIDDMAEALKTIIDPAIAQAWQKRYDNARSSDERSAIARAAAEQGISVGGSGNRIGTNYKEIPFKDQSITSASDTLKNYYWNKEKGNLSDYVYVQLTNGEFLYANSRDKLMDMLKWPAVQLLLPADEDLYIRGQLLGSEKISRKDIENHISLSKYKKGGLVNYTGLAQVDGTPNRPEAFLSADDTEAIGNAAKLLSTMPMLRKNTSTEPITASNGDTTIEININVESIGDDYDVDRLINRVKDDIEDAANPIGTPVIIRKRN